MLSSLELALLLLAAVVEELAHAENRLLKG